MDTNDLAQAIPGAEFVVFCLFIVAGLVSCAVWAWQNWPQKPGLPAPDRSTLRRPIVDPNWTVERSERLEEGCTHLRAEQ